MSMTQCPLVSELNTQRTLLTETLDILESNLGALRMGAINDERIDNHCRAIAAIRQHIYGETTRDTAQETNAHIQQKTLPQMSALPTLLQAKRYTDAYANYLPSLKRFTRSSDQVLLHGDGRQVHCSNSTKVWVWPWHWGASLRAIDRRIQKAVVGRNLMKAQRLDIVRQALIRVRAEDEARYDRT